MHYKRRLARIDRNLRPSEEFHLKVTRGHVSYERWESRGTPNDERPSVDISGSITIVIRGAGDSETDLAIMNAVKSGDTTRSRAMNELVDAKILEGTFGCVELRDPVEGSLLVCGKDDWSAVKEREDCHTCKQRRIIYRVYTAEERKETLARLDDGTV